MRRPTFCTSIDQDGSATDNSSEKESRLSKMKRMITGGILMGRKNTNSKSMDGKENTEHLDCPPGRMNLDIVRSPDGLNLSVRPSHKECLIHGQPLKEVHIEVAVTPQSATTELVLMPRKRKERLDSGGSIKQETKVIRSSSEERPESTNQAVVRRVSSHGELITLAQHIPCSPADIKTDTEALELLRNTERFARSVCAPRSGRRMPKKRKTSPRGEVVKKRETTVDLPVTPKLDVESLHRHVEGGEPVRSRALSPDDEPESPAVEALISPRNSLVMRLTYLDPNLPPSPPNYHYTHHMNQHERREKRLTKQLHALKRQLKQSEQQFEADRGFKPTQADKVCDVELKRLCGELNKVKMQLCQLREESKDLKSMLATDQGVEEKRTGEDIEEDSGKTGRTVEEVIREIEKRLEEKRQISSRGTNILEMTREQLNEEKLATQKALLHFENICGRPSDAQDKELARPLYQRYRTLKRLVLRNQKTSGSSNELATILEHEMMEFSNPSSVDLTENGSKSPNNEPEEAYGGSSSSSSDSLGENLHALPLSQLLEQQKAVKEEKKRLRRNLREFEERFQSETGRRARKQDRVQIEGIYVGYKQSKAKLRLLEALIAKKSQVKRNSC